MVNKMITLFSLFLLFICANSSASLNPDTHDSGLVGVLSSEKVELGDSIFLTFSTTESTLSLKEMDLSRLRTSFYVEFIEHKNELQDREFKQLMSLRLFPRRVGLISLPSFKLGSLTTVPKVIEVLPPQDIMVELTQQPGSIQLMQQQQWVVQMKIRSVTPFFTIQLGENKDKTIEATSIVTRKELVRNELGKFTEQTVVWSISTYRTGKFDMEVPPVNLIQGGKLQKVFYFPKYSLEVKPLPSYVPPSIAIGSVRMFQRFETSSILSTGNIYYWHIELSGSGIQPLTIPSVTNQLQTTRKVQYYPAEVTRSYRLRDGVVVGSIHYKIPFEPLVLGYHSLPRLEVNSFNPSTRRLLNQSVSGKTFLVVNTTAMLFFILLTLLLIYVAVLPRIKRLHNYVVRRYERNQALLDLKSAATTSEIRAALQNYAQAHTWKKNLSIQSWLDYFVVNYGRTERLGHLCEQLQYELYSGKAMNANEFDILKTNLFAVLNKSGFKLMKVE